MTVDELLSPGGRVSCWLAILVLSGFLGFITMQVFADMSPGTFDSTFIKVVFVACFVLIPWGALSLLIDTIRKSGLRR